MTIQQQYQQTKVLTGPQNGDGLTMNSQEIADLVNSRHDNVKVAIERLAKKGVIQLPAMQDFGIINNLGLPRSVSAYVFTGKQGKRDSLIVVAQLCPEFTARIVDRWQELEEQARAPQQLTTLEILQIAMQSEQERLRLEAANHELELQVEAAKPKVEALERIAVADGSLNLTEAAKALQQQPKKFNQHLCSQRWIYKRAGGKQWLGYQDKVQQGLVEHKVTMVPLADGGERLCEQVRITPKGLTRLAQQLSMGGVQ